MSNIHYVIISGIAGHGNWIFCTIDFVLGANVHMQIYNLYMVLEKGDLWGEEEEASFLQHST